MSKPLRTAGKVKAYVRALAVTESPQKKLPQLAIELGCYEMEMQLQQESGQPLLDAGGRAQIGFARLDDEYSVMDYLPLAYFNGDNQPTFTKTFENIQGAFNWTPDPNRLWESLQEIDLSQLRVQAVIQEEEYQGKPQFKIAFINPLDYEGGGVRPLDAPVLAQLSNQWAGAFRAKFGNAGAAAPAPAPAATAPAPAVAPAPVAGDAPATAPPAATPAPAPPASTTSPAPAGPAGSAGATKEGAWTAFYAANKKADTVLSDQSLQLEWYRILKTNLNAPTDAEISQLTPEQWAWMRDHAASEIIPF